MISIIVPVYNVEQYLPQCIASLTAQTEKDIEILLIDDGSTDMCGEICDQFADLDTRIHVWHKENGGLSDARNFGIERARGEYLTFVDSDDWIHPQMCELLKRGMEEQGADMAVACYERENSQFAKEQFDYASVECMIMDNTEAMKNIYKLTVTACNKLYKRELFSSNRYPYGKYHEDEFLIHRLLFIASKIVFLNQKLYFYTRRDSSIMQSAPSAKRTRDALEALCDRVNFCIASCWEPVIGLAVKWYCEYALYAYYEFAEYSDIENKELCRFIVSEIRLQLKCNYRYMSLKYRIKLILFLRARKTTRLLLRV